MKTVAIIQARMGSERLPGKVMLDLCGKTVLDHVITRVRQANEIDEIVIATTTDERDDVIETEAKRLETKCFRGSEDDVLSRYYYAAQENTADIVVRITSDCPLIDWNIIDEVIKAHKSGNYEIVTNAGLNAEERTFPRGLDIEVFSFEVLEKAHHRATEQYQREHVTPYIYESSDKTFYYKNKINYSQYRWTLDTAEDWELISSIYRHLYHGVHDFGLDEIIELMEKEPNLQKINAHIEQKKI